MDNMPKIITGQAGAEIDRLRAANKRLEAALAALVEAAEAVGTAARCLTIPHSNHLDKLDAAIEAAKVQP
jgi:hypothetical protein